MRNAGTPGEASVLLDLHGKTQYQARVALEAALLTVALVLTYRLRVEASRASQEADPSAQEADASAKPAGPSAS